MTDEQFYLVSATLFSFFLYIILRGFEKFVLPRFFKPDRLLEKKEAELHDQIEDLKRRLSRSEEKNKELEINQELLLKQLRKANVKSEQLEEQVKGLSQEVHILQRSAPITPVETKPFTGRVLGVWPETDHIDTSGERYSIAKTGLEYEALEGAMATRRGIVEQLSQQKYKIVEIGARGSAEGIKLYDGITSPSWWMQLARQHEIEIFVIMANESSKPGVENVADSLFNAGAKAVVSVDSSITDKDAVELVNMFYRRLSRGVSIQKALEYARLVISDSGADAVKLRIHN